MRLGELIKALESVQTVCGADADTTAYAVELQITTSEKRFPYSYYPRNPEREVAHWVRITEAPKTEDYVIQQQVTGD